ncbi:MAG: septum formation family protein [Mycobacteriaceae bacterium]|nr:septum formation family protein [Mycobacteriaceae bacterium]
MDQMSDAPENEQPPASQPIRVPARFRWPRTLQAASTRRTLLLTALGGLLIAGMATAIPAGGSWPGRLASYIDADPVPNTAAKGNAAIDHANSGDCLMWPDGKPADASIVSCTAEHRFEVAKAIDMRTFPGSEYGLDAAPPSATRIQQITVEQCDAAVRNYLGPRFDPDSKFSTGLLWAGDKAWRQDRQRRMLCGLELPGEGDQQIAFHGKVAELDQSRVWPAGTCLGVDLTSNQPTDIPVNCASPHAMEITGIVNLAEKFPPTAPPPEPEQDDFVKEACTRLTDGYLAPIQLRTTTLTLTYNTLSPPSWSAGSHEVACSIGATLGNGGWATLTNSAKGALLINGQPPIPPPDIPEERLNPPSIPLPSRLPVAPPPSQVSTPAPVSQRPTTQHLPQQPAAPPHPPAAPIPAGEGTPAPGEQAPPPNEEPPLAADSN